LRTASIDRKPQYPAHLNRPDQGAAMTVKIILDLQLKPEDVARSQNEIHNLLAATRGFDGCVGVDVLIAIDDPAHVVFVETWDSAEQYKAYNAWRATPEGASVLGEMLAGRPTATHFTLADGV
jgi:quinol monooxygenase YgiN